MNKILLGLFSFAAVLAAPIATFNQSLAQSSTPASTEAIEEWNTELRDQVRRLEAEKEGVELRQRARRLQAAKENAELHERVRQLQTDLSSAQSPALQQPSPQPQRAAPESSPQPQRAAAVSSPQPQGAAAESSPRPQRAAPAERKPSRPNETEARRESPRQAAVEQQSPASSAFPWYPSWSSQPAAPAAAVPAAAVPAAAVPAAAVPAASDAVVVVHGTIDLNSSPEGALAQTSLGAGCETPCAMEVSTDRPFSVTFKQRGYTLSTVTIQIQRAQPGVADPKFSPNPVFVQLTPSRTR